MSRSVMARHFQIRQAAGLRSILHISVQIDDEAIATFAASIQKGKNYYRIGFSFRSLHEC